MKYILDTHTFIWWHNNTSHLSDTVLAICEDINNELFLSIVSIWEMQTKMQLDKLKSNTSLMDMITLQQANGIHILPLSIEHIMCLDTIEQHHNDSFDRLLIAQATVEDALILTKDNKFKPYNVQTVW
jgi:PIN domain nuclease of toxin-antitoxin system